QQMEARQLTLQRLRSPEAMKVKADIRQLQGKIKDKVEEITQQDLVSSAKIGVAVHDPLINRLKRNIRFNAERGEGMSEEDRVAFSYLKDTISPIMSQMRALLENIDK